jgi:hypothetical protein
MWQKSSIQFYFYLGSKVRISNRRDEIVQTVDCLFLEIGREQVMAERRLDISPIQVSMANGLRNRFSFCPIRRSSSQSS